MRLFYFLKHQNDKKITVMEQDGRKWLMPSKLEKNDVTTKRRATKENHIWILRCDACCWCAASSALSCRWSVNYDSCRRWYRVLCVLAVNWIACYFLAVWIWAAAGLVLLSWLAFKRFIVPCVLSVTWSAVLTSLSGRDFIYETFNVSRIRVSGDVPATWTPVIVVYISLTFSRVGFVHFSGALLTWIHIKIHWIQICIWIWSKCIHRYQSPKVPVSFHQDPWIIPRETNQPTNGPRRKHELRVAVIIVCTEAFSCSLCWKCLTKVTMWHISWNVYYFSF